MTTFLLLKNYDHYVIVNDDADFIAGSVYPLNGHHGPYKVSADVGPMDRDTTEAGVVNSLNDAIPAVSGGALSANPMFVAGLERIGFAAQHIWSGSAGRVLAHATSGPALQQNLVAVLEGNN